MIIIQIQPVTVEDLSPAVVEVLSEVLSLWNVYESESIVENVLGFKAFYSMADGNTKERGSCA